MQSGNSIEKEAEPKEPQVTPQVTPQVMPQVMQMNRNLTVRPVIFHTKAQIDDECMQVWNREFAELDRLPPVVRYTFGRHEEDCKFFKEDLQKKVDFANRALGREYHKMNDEDKRKYLDSLAAEDELRKIKDRLHFEDDVDAQNNDLKQ